MHNAKLLSIIHTILRLSIYYSNYITVKYIHTYIIGTVILIIMSYIVTDKVKFTYNDRDFVIILY